MLSKPAPENNSYLTRFSLWIFFLACLAAAVLSFKSSIAKPFTLDEALLATRGHMIMTAGMKGPQMALGSEGLTHPPLYECTLALLFKLFGETEIPTRSFGILIYILVGFFMLKTFSILSKNESHFFRQTGLFLCLTLYLANPLLIQHSLLVDAESTWTAFFSACFVFTFIRFEGASGKNFWISRAGLAFILAASFLGKEVTPFLLLFGVLLYRILNRQWKRLFFDGAVIALIGALVVLAAAGIYRQTTGMNLEIFLHKQFSFRVGRISKAAFYWRTFLSSPLIARWPVFWVSAPFFILLLAAIFSRAVHFFKEKKIEAVDYCLITGAAVWIPYFFVKPSVDMMKYQHPVYPFFILAIALYLCRLFLPYEKPLREFFKKRGWASLFFPAVIAAAAVYYYRLGDYILQLAMPKNDPVWKQFLFVYYGPIAAAFLGAALWSFWKRRYFRPLCAALCLVFIFAINTGLNLRQTAPYTTAESWLNYGESGLPETAKYLLDHVTDKSVISARADVLYYLRYVHPAKAKTMIDLPEFLPSGDWGRYGAMMENEAFDFIVLDRVSLSYLRPNARIKQLISKYFVPVKRFGYFQVLESKKHFIFTNIRQKSTDQITSLT